MCSTSYSVAFLKKKKVIIKPFHGCIVYSTIHNSNKEIEFTVIRYFVQMP